MIHIDIFTRSLDIQDSVSFHHNYCGRSDASYYGIENDYNFCCMHCGMFYVLPDNKILLPAYKNRSLIYYSEGNVLWIKNQGKRRKIPSHSNGTFFIEQKSRKDVFNFTTLKILHECNSHTLTEVNNNPPILTCKNCHQKFDFNNPSLLTAVFNAAIENISSEVSLYNICDFNIKPMKTKI